MATRRASQALIAVVLIAVAGSAGAAVSGLRAILTEALEPEMIAVAPDGAEIYLVDRGRILVYSLEDFRLLRKIGGPGPGPGELHPADFWRDTVTVLRDEIFVDGFDKTLRFLRDGRFLNERKKPLGLSRMVPIGANFAGLDLDFREDDVQFQRLLLLDADGKILRELARQPSPVQSVRRETEMIPDVLMFAVWRDRIYVEKSREGFIIDVFDSRGAFLDRIEKKVERTKPTKEQQQAALELLEADPFVRRLGVEPFKRFSRLTWPKTLPPIRDLTVADGHIYARTSGEREGKEEWMVLSLDGRDGRIVRLPRRRGVSFMASLQGATNFAVNGGKLYFLEYDETAEAWALVVEEIRP